MKIRFRLRDLFFGQFIFGVVVVVLLNFSGGVLKGDQTSITAPVAKLMLKAWDWF